MKYFYNKKIGKILGYEEGTGLIEFDQLQSINIVGDVHEISNEGGGSDEKTTGKRQRTCSECGKKGHSRRTCGRDEEKGELDEMALSRKQFADVKEAKDHEMVSKDIAENMGVGIKEINLAMGANTYASYLEARRE